MAIKKLQNDFTTIEQSKRLLKLGVPANSANCYFDDYDEGVYVLDKTEDTNNFFTSHPECIPCWSVGRLIEIYHICDKPGCSFSFNVCFPNLISEMMYMLVEAKEHGWIDFSKLED